MRCTLAWVKRFLIAVPLVLGLSVNAQAGGANSFAQVRPILEAKCVECHDASRQEANLRLDTRENALKAGDTGYPAVIPGNATFSNVVKRITLLPDNPDVMPPQDHSTLNAEEILTIIHWINAGAPWEEVTLVAKGGADAPAAAIDLIPAPAPAPVDLIPTPAPAPEPAPAVEAAPTAAPGEGTVDFAAQVLPIFEARCFECHGAESQKEELRVDTKEGILKGSRHGAVLVAGKAEDSPLYTLLTLPADHPDIMPAKGEPLTAEQIALVRTWIDEGAGFGDWVAFAAQVSGPVNLLEKLAENVEPVPQEKLAKLQEKGAVAMQLGQTSPLVRVDFQLVGDEVTDATLSELAELAPQLTWLNLATTKVTDEGLAQLAPLTKLTSLHLEKTGITDAGLAHLSGLENLQYLNLYGTQVSDAGLAHLKDLKQLRRLYVWQTQVTQEGAASLKQALPEVDVNLGAELTVVPAAAEKTAAAEVASLQLALFYDKEGCCGKAAAEGKECDHPCCVEARGKGEVCAKCNPGAAAKQQLAAQFAADGCCATALGEGKECDHPCCVEARAKGEVCVKCNPGAAQPAAAPADAAPGRVVLAVDAESCCGKSQADSKTCEHPCCVEAADKNTVCFKCNPVAAKTAALDSGLKEDGCCFKAFVAEGSCEHPCCVEAGAAGAVCEKCNPKAA